MSNESEVKASKLDLAREFLKANPDMTVGDAVYIKTFAKWLDSRDASETPAPPQIHGIRYDVVGWICSVCHAWCDEDFESCAHPHRSAQETFPPTGPVGNTSPVDTATGGKPVGGDAAKAEPTPTLTCLECGLILPGLHQPWCSKARTQNG